MRRKLHIQKKKNKTIARFGMIIFFQVVLVFCPAHIACCEYVNFWQLFLSKIIVIKSANYKRRVLIADHSTRDNFYHSSLKCAGHAKRVQTLIISVASGTTDTRRDVRTHVAGNVDIDDGFRGVPLRLQGSVKMMVDRINYTFDFRNASRLNSRGRP